MKLKFTFLLLFTFSIILNNINCSNGVNITSFEIMQNFLRDNINVIDSDMLKQTQDIVALFQDSNNNDDSDENERKCYKLDMKAEQNQQYSTKIEQEIEINKIQKKSNIEFITAQTKKCDKLNEKDCHMLFTTKKKEGELINMQQTSILKLYKSQQEKLTASEMILQRVIYEYQMMSPRPFLWTCANNPIDNEDKNIYNIQRRFVSVENVLKKYEESFMTEEELGKRLLMSSILLKKMLILIQNIGGLRQYECIKKDKINEDIEVRKRQFIESLQRLMTENESKLQESPLDYLIYFEPTKYFKLCQNDFFHHNPIFLSDLELDSFSFTNDILQIQLQSVIDQKLILNWQDAIEIVSNRNMLVKKIVEKMIQSIRGGNGEGEEINQDGKLNIENGILEITEDKSRIKRSEENIGKIMKEVVYIYSNIIEKIYENIKFSPLIVPKFHYGKDSQEYMRQKEEKMDFHDIMLQFEKGTKIMQKKRNTRNMQNDDNSNNNDNGNDEDDNEQEQNEQDIDIKYRKHFVLRTFMQLTQKLMKRYISEDLELFNCLKPYTKFQYDNCPEFMQEMITEIDLMSNKKIEWSQMRDLIFGYVFGDAEKLNIDIEIFINNIFVYAREKLQKIKEEKKEKVNLRELIEGVIEYENMKLQNLQRLASIKVKREII